MFLLILRLISFVPTLTNPQTSFQLSLLDFHTSPDHIPSNNLVNVHKEFASFWLFAFFLLWTTNDDNLSPSKNLCFLHFYKAANNISFYQRLLHSVHYSDKSYPPIWLLLYLTHKMGGERVFPVLPVLLLNNVVGFSIGMNVYKIKVRENFSGSLQPMCSQMQLCYYRMNHTTVTLS